MDISISVDAYQILISTHSDLSIRHGLLLIPVYRNVHTPEMAQIYSLSQQRWPLPVPLLYFG